jgi:diguanylate cyclase (GGDEF)-like protein/PAS domain S-box-containing protein
MSMLNAIKLRPFLPRAMATGFLLLWALITMMVWINWRVESTLIEEKVRNDADAALQSKAMEIEGALKRTYHTIRTISLLPGVRVSPQINRTSADQDVVALGRMSSTDFETVQQLYNHIAASVSVSEVYIVHDGFRPELGQVPFAMFDQVIVDRINRAAALNNVKNGSADSPEQDESEEYLDYVRQLAYFRTSNPVMPVDGLEGILPVNSGLLRTCDNSQYTSVRHGDVRNTFGFSMSVPIFDLFSRRFKGLVTAVLRSNVLEAILIGLPEVPLTDAERAAMLANKPSSAQAHPTNFVLQDTRSSIRIHDRRNLTLANGNPDAGLIAHQSTVTLELAGEHSWVMSNYVSVSTLDRALAPGREAAIGQVAVLSMILGLFWWSLRTMLRRQHRATQKIRVLADELDTSAQNLARARTEFQATLDAIPDLLFELGLTGKIYDCNSRSADPLIPSGMPFVGKTVSEAMPPALATVFLAALMEANAHGSSTGRQCELILAQGNRWFELYLSPKTKSQGDEARFVALVRDITERRAAEDQIQSLAFYDALTRLPNRRLLMDRLKHALASGSRRVNKRGLLFVDLDNFKSVNEALGHDAGDLLLQQVAKRLTACIREGDTVAHLGGDEFVVMLEELSEDVAGAAMQTESVGEKILSSLSKPYQFSGYTHNGSASIGATLFGDSQESFEEPLKRADYAMCQAKAAGRNTLRFFYG